LQIRLVIPFTGSDTADYIADGSSAGSNRARASNSRTESKMPVKIFVVQGDKSIGGLESEINKWQQSLGSKASVTQISTAMTDHQHEAEDWHTRLAVTIWYEL
jgi:hypothetical protein